MDYIEFFIKHPTDQADLKDSPRLIASSRDVCFKDTHKTNIALDLYESLEFFKKTRNPYFAIKSFLCFQELGVFPTKSILDWLEASFSKWIEEDGALTMDKAMGLSKGKGQRLAIRQAKNELLEYELMEELLLLKNTFKISTLDAAGMVSARLADETSAENNVSYNTSTLNEKFYTWKKKRRKGERIIMDLYSTDDSDKRRLVSNYPEHSFHDLPEVKQYYKPK